MAADFKFKRNIDLFGQPLIYFTIPENATEEEFDFFLRGIKQQASVDRHIRGTLPVWLGTPVPPSTSGTPVKESKKK